MFVDVIPSYHIYLANADVLSKSFKEYNPSLIVVRSRALSSKDLFRVENGVHSFLSDFSKFV